jgi:hypothetical protein
MSMALRIISSASERSTTLPPFMPLAAVCEKPSTRTPWLRRRNTSRGACGSSLAMRQTTFEVPTSMAATTAERFGGTGFILGVTPNRTTLLMPRLPSWSSWRPFRPP